MILHSYWMCSYYLDEGKNECLRDVRRHRLLHPGKSYFPNFNDPLDSYLFFIKNKHSLVWTHPVTHIQRRMIGRNEILLNFFHYSSASLKNKEGKMPSHKFLFDISPTITVIQQTNKSLETFLWSVLRFFSYPFKKKNILIWDTLYAFMHYYYVQ